MPRCSIRKGGRARRLVSALVAVIAMSLTCALALPAGSEAATQWVCEVPEDGTTVEVVFVSAPDAAYYPGIVTANSRAGAVFGLRFGEDCSVRHVPDA